MGQICVYSSPIVLICAGLGSCLGVVAFDPGAKVAGAASVMLPESVGPSENIGRYANLAIPSLIAELEARGAARDSLRCAIAGGAQVFRSGSAPAHLDIGARNKLAVLKQLEDMGLTCIAEDCGGDLARTLSLDTSTGAVKVTTALGGERLLCNLVA